MWDFEHPPLIAELAQRYQIDSMLPSECADQFATGAADIGLVPIAALATTPGLRILPGCTIASKDRCARFCWFAAQISRSQSAQCGRRYSQPHHPGLRAHSLSQVGESAMSPSVPMTADLDAMLDHADAAIRHRRSRSDGSGRTRQPLRAHRRRACLSRPGRRMARPDGLPFVSAVWAAAHGQPFG